MSFKTIVFLLLSICSIVISSSFAQVARPQQNPYFKSQSAAAVGWRKVTWISAGGEYYQGEKETLLENNIGLRLTGEQLNIKAVFDKIILELHGSRSKQQHDEILFETVKTEYDLMVAYRHMNKFTLGLQVGRHEVTGEEPKLNTWRDAADANFDSTNVVTGLSGSVRLYPALYLGGGVNYVSNEHTKRVPNKWLERNIGLSYSTGGDEPVVRVEATWYHTPRKKERAVDPLMINHQRRTDRYQLMIDGQSGTIVYMVEGVKKVERAPTENTTNIVTDIYRVGVGNKFFSSRLQVSIHASRTRIKDRFFVKDLYGGLLTVGFPL